MKRIFLILLLLIGFWVANAQEASGTISGIIINRYNEPLVGANVLVIGTMLGSVTNESGMFEIRQVPTGKYTVAVSLLGYKATTVSNVSVFSGRTISLRIKLDETAIPVEEVRIIGEWNKQKQDDPRTSLRYMQPQASKSLPGFGEDVLRSLQALPGVIAANDFSSQLIIRGSGPDQNLIVMDDIEIFNPYRLYGFISMFNPETVNEISLITGGFPAKYGDRLSAILDVTNRTGGIRKEPFKGSVNVSITNMNIVLDGNAPFGMPGSYLFSGRRTYYDLIIGPFAKKAGLVSGEAAFPNFSDVQGKIILNPFKNHNFILNGLRSRDGVNIISGPQRQTADSMSTADETNHYVIGLAWHWIPSDEIFTKFVASYYNNDGNSDFGGSIIDPSLDRERFQDRLKDTLGIRLFSLSGQSKYIFEKYSFKEEMTYKFERSILEAGGGIDFIETGLDFRFDADPSFKAFVQGMGRNIIERVRETKKYYRAHLYLQNKFQLNDKFIIQPGFRFDYYEIIHKAYLAPRLNFSYAFDEITTLRGAFGYFYQSPGYEKLVDQPAAFTFLDDKYARQLEASRAVHYVLGLDRWVTEVYRFTMDLYYKKFNNLLAAKVVTGTKYETSLKSGEDPRLFISWNLPVAISGDSVTNIPINGSFGEAFGVEFLLEKLQTTTDSRLTGWVSYALSYANRNENGRWLPFNFDQRHTLNLVGNYRLNNWLDLGFTWRFGTNFPYTPAVGVKPRIITVEATPGNIIPIVQPAMDPFFPTDLTKARAVFDVDRGDYSNRRTSRKPLYHRLDLRLTAYTTFWGLDWGFYLDIINAYNRANVVGYQYFVNDDLTLGVRETSMFPIIPTIGVNVKF